MLLDCTVPVGCVAKAGHKNVIEIDKNYWKASKDPVLHVLERLSGIEQAEGYLDEFPQAKRCDDGSFGDRVRRNWNYTL